MVTKKVQWSFSGCLFLENTEKLRNLDAAVIIVGRVTESELSDNKTLSTLFFFFVVFFIQDSYYSNYKELIKKKLIKKF